MALFHTTVVDNQIKALDTIGTASGSIATFETDISDSLVNLEVAITATGGGGTPVSPIAINGFTGANVVACGKNLAFDYIDNCNIDASGNLVWNTSYKMYIAKVEQGKTYSTNLGSLVGGYFDKIPVLNDVSYDGTRVITTSTFTATHTGFIAFRALSTDTQISLKVGTDTTYTAYNGTTETIPFGQTVYGGRLNVGSGVLTVTHKIVDFGELIWTYYGGRFYSSALTDIGGEVVGYYYKNTMCSCYEKSTSGSNNTYFIFSSNNIIYVYDNAYTDAEQFKTARTGQKIVYELATPTTIQLDSKQMQSIIGTNNVYSDTGDIIDLKFVLSVGKAIS